MLSAGRHVATLGQDEVARCSARRHRRHIARPPLFEHFLTFVTPERRGMVYMTTAEPTRLSELLARRPSHSPSPHDCLDSSAAARREQPLTFLEFTTFIRRPTLSRLSLRMDCRLQLAGRPVGNIVNGIELTRRWTGRISSLSDPLFTTAYCANIGKRRLRSVLHAAQLPATITAICAHRRRRRGRFSICSPTCRSTDRRTWHCSKAPLTTPRSFCQRPARCFTQGCLR